MEALAISIPTNRTTRNTIVLSTGNWLILLLLSKFLDASNPSVFVASELYNNSLDQKQKGCEMCAVNGHTEWLSHFKCFYLEFDLFNEFHFGNRGFSR